jgi:uncharacterized protein YbjT (DUF2867 family)
LAEVCDGISGKPAAVQHALSGSRGGPPQAAKAAYGPYVEPVEGSCSDADSLRGALRGAKLVICSGAVGALNKAMQGLRGVDNVVLLSAAGITRGAKADGGLFGMFSADVSERKALLSEKREAKVASCGLPYTIVRVPAFKVLPLSLTLTHLLLLLLLLFIALVHLIQAAHPTPCWFVRALWPSWP